MNANSALYFETQHALLLSRALEAIDSHGQNQLVCVQVETDPETNDHILKMISVAPDRCLESQIIIMERHSPRYGGDVGTSALTTVAEQTGGRDPATNILNAFQCHNFEPFSVRLADLRLALDLVLPHTPPRVTIVYPGPGRPLTVILKVHDHITGQAQIATQPLVNDLIGVDFDPSDARHQVVLSSDHFARAFTLKGKARLDQSNFIRFRFTQDPPQLVVLSGTATIECQTAFPLSPNNPAVQECQTDFEEAEFGYRPALLFSAVAALKHAVSTRLLISEDGVLSIAHLTPRESPVACYVQYYLMPLVDDE